VTRAELADAITQLRGWKSADRKWLLSLPAKEQMVALELVALLEARCS
jgi:hypothetical protein